MNKLKCLTILLLLMPVVVVNAGQGANLIAELPGRIAYIGDDYNVYVFDPDHNDHHGITNDASNTRRYQWPTWSTDGRLAYFRTELASNQLLMGVYISEDGAAEGEQVYASENEVFQYAYWSPQNCQHGDNCRDLAVLISSRERGLLVEMIRDMTDGHSSQTVGRGAPFYQSWSPDGQRMLWQRDQNTFEIFDAGSAEVIETLPQQPGFIQAPAWSPVDDRLLFGVLGSDERSTNLVIAGHDEVLELAAELSGLVSFSWSPDGNRVAYRIQTGASTFGPVFVVDAVSSEVVARSVVSGVLAFFWSPDSTQLAYVTAASPPGTFSARDESGSGLAAVVQQMGGLAWSVLRVADGATSYYGAFMPTEDMRYLLQYFDQFSQSHRLWSPDSNYLIYGELTQEGPFITLLDTKRVDSVPFSVAPGGIGIWSFN